MWPDNEDEKTDEWIMIQTDLTAIITNSLDEKYKDNFQELKVTTSNIINPRGGGAQETEEEAENDHLEHADVSRMNFLKESFKELDPHTFVNRMKHRYLNLVK